jgi:nucleotide-binding universal stress UspA family protein
VLADEHVHAEVRCRIGSPARVLLEETGKYDLTVIGGKGRNSLSDVGLGPVASRVIEHAPGCVLVAREFEQEKGARILVPFDGSDGSRQALNALTGLFDLASAEITLLHVVETHWLGIKPEEEELSQEPETDPDEASLLMELRREGEQVLSEARVRLLEHHAGVTTLLREGDPANEILSEAEQGEYDLVVLGASGSTDLNHTMLGSVSSKVTWTARCSVLLVGNWS